MKRNKLCNKLWIIDKNFTKRYHTSLCVRSFVGGGLRVCILEIKVTAKFIFIKSGTRSFHRRKERKHEENASTHYGARTEETRNNNKTPTRAITVCVYIYIYTLLLRIKYEYRGIFIFRPI